MAKRDEPANQPVPRWLAWSRALQGIAQAGLTYSRDGYDLERFRHVRRVAAEIAAAGSGDEPEAVEGFFASERGYPTPKLDVRAAVVIDDLILLVQERDDGGWSLPGGCAVKRKYPERPAVKGRRSL